MLNCRLCLQHPPPQTCCTCCHLHPDAQVPSLQALEAERDSLLAANQVWGAGALCGMQSAGCSTALNACRALA